MVRDQWVRKGEEARGSAVDRWNARISAASPAGSEAVSSVIPTLRMTACGRQSEIILI
jgi:hypothetical protein